MAGERTSTSDGIRTEAPGLVDPTRSLKIVNVGINLIPSRGGIYRTVVSFMEAFQDLHYRPRVVNFGSSYEGEFEYSAPCTFIKTFSFPVLSGYHFWNGFYRDLAEKVIGAPCLVVIHGLFYHAAAAVASYCRNRGIPYVVVSHGSLDPYVFTYRRMRKEFWTRLYRKSLLVESSAVVFSTGAEAEKAAKWTTGSKVRIIPWSVGYCPDYDKNKAKAMVLEKYGLPPDTQLALFCGRMDPFKRPLETIRDFKAIAEKGWVLLMVGPPTIELPAVVVEAACGEPGARVIYAGAMYGESLGNYFRAADLLILLSHRENFSHVTAEALALGIPVLLSQGVDLWRDLAPAGAAFVTADSQDLDTSAREALGRVLGMDRNELAASGQRGRDWVRTELSQQRFVERVRELCESIVKKGH